MASAEVRAPSGAPTARRHPWATLAIITVPSVVGVVAVAARPLTDPAAWLHVRLGQVLREGWQLAGPDPLSTATAKPFVATTWAGDLLGSLAYDAMGTGGVALIQATVMVVLAALFVASARSVADTVPAVIAAFVGLFGCLDLGARPLAAGIALSMVCVIGWRRAAESGRPPWWLIPLGWVWACLHPTWVVGPLVGAVTILGLALDGRMPPRQRGRLAAVAVLSALAAGATPVGPRLLQTPFDAFPAAGAAIAGWQLVDVTNLGALVVGGATLLLAAAVLRGGVRPAGWKLAHGGLAMGLCLTVNRAVPIAACLVVPLVAEALQARRGVPALPVRSLERRWYAVGTVVALAASACLAIPLGRLSHDPVAGFSAELAHLPADSVVLDLPDTSGWLLLNQPRLRLVMDTRVELYDPGYVAHYLAALKAEPGWDAFVDQTRATSALLPVEAPLATALTQRRGWHLVQTAGGLVLLVAP